MRTLRRLARTDRVAIATATIVAAAALIAGTAAPDAVTRGNLRDWFIGSAHSQTPTQTPTQIPQRSRNLPEFADVIERVKAAVVGIRVQVEDTTIGAGSPLDDLLGEPKGKDDDKDNDKGKGKSQGQPRLSTNQGSGFFISADGYLVTTNHVIENGKKIEIVTDDDRTLPARVVGADPMTDLALLKVDGPDPFPQVRMSERPPRIGEWVFAIGNPFGLGGTVTVGIVSARARDIQQANYNDFIQIDAAINRGSSGGPTFDSEGDVIGVNSAIFSPAGVSVGIGFAIPAETVTSVIGQLKDKGSVVRGWVGIQVTTITEELAQKLGVKETGGALVVEPQADSPATKAGLAAGDIIMSVDGVPVKDDRDLVRRISSRAPGTAVDLGVVRKGEALTIKLTLGELPQKKSRG